MAYHWCREDVAGLKELGVELHAQEDAFRPDDPVTRAEFTAMLYTALEQKEALPQAPRGWRSRTLPTRRTAGPPTTSIRLPPWVW